MPWCLYGISTDKYGVPVFNLLEDNINVTITNLKWVKAVKGNMDDTKDSKWIGDLFRLGLVPGIYIHYKPIRILRGFTKYRYKLTSYRSSEKTDTRMRLSSVMPHYTRLFPISLGNKILIHSAQLGCLCYPSCPYFSLLSRFIILQMVTLDLHQKQFSTLCHDDQVRICCYSAIDDKTSSRNVPMPPSDIWQPGQLPCQTCSSLLTCHSRNLSEKFHLHISIEIEKIWLASPTIIRSFIFFLSSVYTKAILSPHGCGVQMIPPASYLYPMRA